MSSLLFNVFLHKNPVPIPISENMVPTNLETLFNNISLLGIKGIISFSNCP